ncbi:MAG: outer membrane protein assembly factor BamE [Steroidobacteraceae bacterium]
MRMTLKNLSGAAILTGLLMSAACVYRMPIQQGNFLEASTIDQLETGMTRSQVRFLLGTPMVPLGFDTSRWEYYYYFKGRRLKRADERRVTVYFEDDKVARVERDSHLTVRPAS